MSATGGLGGRITSREPGKACAAQPLARVYHRVKAWLKHEREHGHEVRLKILTQRLLFEVEYDRDQQLVLQEHNSTDFFAPTLESCREKLSHL